MAQKPSIPKGTRDFSPQEVLQRNHIIKILRHNFELFGFQPIETPSFENTETLMGKYGEEGDRLIFKILNSGNFLSKAEIISKYETYIRDLINKKFFEIFGRKEEIENCLKGLKSFSDKLSEKNKIEAKNYLKKYLEDNINIDTLKIQPTDKYFLKKLIEDGLDIILNTFIDFYLKKRFYENPENISSDINKLAFKLITNSNSIEFANHLSSEISEKALRYDLTVPFARYVVQHQNDLEFPFKRYQMQLVWRADRPQKGRFREFLQCDADAVGSDSLLQEVAFIQLYDAVFSDLGLDGVSIKMNNRKILSGIAEVIGAADKLIDFTVALDKLDKIGEDGVVKEMLAKGITEDAIEKIRPIFRASGSNTDRLDLLRDLLKNSKTGLQGIEEIAYIFEKIDQLGLKTANLELNITLARGLNYYTGAIFEVAAPENIKMGSIGGGGRYDDLTGIFGLKNMSGVGISFGVDRIYLVLEELGLFPEQTLAGTQLLFLNFGEKEALYCLKTVARLREKGIKAELYPDSAKMKKQMSHADRRNIKYVVLAGDQEMAKNAYTLKHMKSGDQQEVNFDQLVQKLTS